MVPIALLIAAIIGYWAGAHAALLVVAAIIFGGQLIWMVAFDATGWLAALAAMVAFNAGAGLRLAALGVWQNRRGARR